MDCTGNLKCACAKCYKSKLERLGVAHSSDAQPPKKYQTVQKDDWDLDVVQKQHIVFYMDANGDIKTKEVDY